MVSSRRNRCKGQSVYAKTGLDRPNVLTVHSSTQPPCMPALRCRVGIEETEG